MSLPKRDRNRRLHTNSKRLLYSEFETLLVCTYGSEWMLMFYTINAAVGVKQQFHVECHGRESLARLCFHHIQDSRSLIKACSNNNGDARDFGGSLRETSRGNEVLHLKEVNMLQTKCGSKMD